MELSSKSDILVIRRENKYKSKKGKHTNNKDDNLT
jgi:hypothetical protein